MKITDEFYSNLNDGEVQKRIGSLGKENLSNNIDQQAVNYSKSFWFGKQKTKSTK